MGRTTHIAAALVALTAVAGCSHAATPAAPIGAPRSLHVTVQGATKGASGFYSITPADGSATTRKLFSIGSNGQWRATFSAPVGATVRVVLLAQGKGSCLVTESSPDAQTPHSLSSNLLDVGTLCSVKPD